MARNKSPFDKIIAVRQTLRMYEQFGEVALKGQSIESFLHDVSECYEHLMTVRNMVNSIAALDVEPEVSVLTYIPTHMMREAAED